MPASVSPSPIATAGQPAPSRSGGTAGNGRLTAQLGALLLVLLAALGVTIPFTSQLMVEHIYLGLLLIPVVLAKLAATGYRFIRYYTRAPAYRLAGPPLPLLRAIAPVLVVSTVAVFASGVLLLVDGPGDGLMRTVHKAAFLVWFAVTTVHVLAYVWRTPRLASADWRRGDARLGGSLERRLAAAAAVAAGIVLASLTIGHAGAWTAGR